MRVSKNIKTLITLTALALIAVGGFYLVVEKVFIPASFAAARTKNTQAANELMGMLNESLQNLNQIAQDDQAQKFISALALAKAELARAQDTRAKAVQLADDLSAMSVAAQGITPDSARTLAINAMSNELSLISKIIVYNDSLNSVFQALSYKFSGSLPRNASDIQQSVKVMNTTAQEINALNDSFNQKMAAFDKATK